MKTHQHEHNTLEQKADNHQNNIMIKDTRLSISSLALLAAGLVVALSISLVAAGGGRTRVMSFCSSGPNHATFNEVDTAYKTYLATLDDNEQLKNLVAAGHQSFLDNAGRSRATKQHLAKHAERICSMRDVMAKALEVAEQQGI